MSRNVEVFSAGCTVCDDLVSWIGTLDIPREIDVKVLDMNRPDVAGRARSLGLRAIPAVVIVGEVISCCKYGWDEATLSAAIIGAS